MRWKTSCQLASSCCNVSLYRELIAWFAWVVVPGDRVAVEDEEEEEEEEAT